MRYKCSRRGCQSQAVFNFDKVFLQRSLGSYSHGPSLHNLLPGKRESFMLKNVVVDLLEPFKVHIDNKTFESFVNFESARNDI